MTHTGPQHDSHLIRWFSAKFGLTIVSSYDEYGCYVGDPDPNHAEGRSNTAFGAALDYAACWNGVLFDKLASIELGE